MYGTHIVSCFVYNIYVTIMYLLWFTEYNNKRTCNTCIRVAL